ncbi:MAG: FtsW/RodA/SpoVE family cell cycle protein [Oscillospiraceae bacterium]|nr:FtsW/RodA/SpoVE family cell cycle protein [Oscillospiraceae bacterium]
MREYFQKVVQAIRKGDWVLLLLCLITTAFGCLVIASATSYLESFRYIGMQLVAACIGFVCFAIMATVDAEFWLEHRLILVVFNVLILALLIPFGEEIGGNRSWVKLPGVPFNIQVAEICKISYILIMASVMNAHKERISSFRSVFTMAFHLGLLFVTSFILSGDLGVCSIFIFIFVIMAFVGGVHYFWFAVAGGGIALVFPIVWANLDDYQRLRIEVLFNPALDPSGTGVRWHSNMSLKTLTGGGMTGQGLFSGHRTQNGILTGQHTDFIFSTVGEELGYVGCMAVLLLLACIIARCIWVGLRSQDYARRMICFGAAAALIFQLLINVAMCTGVGPVIGLTLPFISYGATSIVTLYTMLGLVSGVYARPAATSHERYIRAPFLSNR